MAKKPGLADCPGYRYRTKKYKLFAQLGVPVDRLSGFKCRPPAPPRVPVKRISWCNWRPPGHPPPGTGQTNFVPLVPLPGYRSNEFRASIGALMDPPLWVPVDRLSWLKWRFPPLPTGTGQTNFVVPVAAPTRWRGWFLSEKSVPQKWFFGQKKLGGNSLAGYRYRSIGGKLHTSLFIIIIKLVHLGGLPRVPVGRRSSIDWYLPNLLT